MKFSNISENPISIFELLGFIVKLLYFIACEVLGNFTITSLSLSSQSISHIEKETPGESLTFFILSNSASFNLSFFSSRVSPINSTSSVFLTTVSSPAAALVISIAFFSSSFKLSRFIYFPPIFLYNFCLQLLIPKLLLPFHFHLKI